MNFSPVSKAVVIQQDPDNYQLIVSAIGRLGGQSPAMRVRVLTHGPRDAVRCSLEELPTPGTWGLVAFPSEDGRNGHWMGATEPALNDASPGQPATVHPRYAAHYAGGWSFHGPDGTTAEALADGSYLLSGTALPSPTRHTVDGDGQRQATPFTAAERNPSPPGPYPLVARHASGSSIGFDASGDISAAAASGRTVTLSANGATVTIGAAGQVTVQAASGETLTLVATGATIAFDGAGDVTLQSAGGVAARLAGALMTVSVGGATQPVRLVGGGASIALQAE